MGTETSKSFNQFLSDFSREQDTASLVAAPTTPKHIRCQPYLKYHGGQLVAPVQGLRLRNIVLPFEFACQLAVNTRGYI
jgi:hypothetical protein